MIEYQPQVFIWFTIVINITPTHNYNNSFTQAIKQNIVNYINNAQIGETIWLSKVQAYANVSIAEGGQTYQVTSVTMGWSDDENSTPTQGTKDAELLYYQTPQTALAMVTVNIGQPT